MKKIAIVLFVALTILMVSGCATNFTTSNGMLSYGEVKGSEVGEVAGEARMMYLIHPSLISFSAPNEELETIIEPAMAEVGATAVKDVNCYTGNGFSCIPCFLNRLRLPECKSNRNRCKIRIISDFHQGELSFCKTPLFLCSSKKVSTKTLPEKNNRTGQV